AGRRWIVPHGIDVALLPPEQVDELWVERVEPRGIEVAPPVEVVPDVVVGQQPCLAEGNPRRVAKCIEPMVAGDNALDPGHDVEWLPRVFGGLNVAHDARSRENVAWRGSDRTLATGRARIRVGPAAEGGRRAAGSAPLRSAKGR